MLLRGCIRIFLFYDVGEAFALDKLQALVSPGSGKAQPDFPRRTPEYVRFENPPIVEPSEPLTLPSGEKVVCSIKYYEYAIVEVQMEVPFEGSWDSLQEQTARWMDAPDIEPEARAAMNRHLRKTAAAIVKPREEWLQESYLVVDLLPAKNAQGRQLSGEEILSTYGERIGQLLRGEQAPLSRGSNERPEEAVRTIQILEYARMQLLEFRYYDNFMNRVLTDVYNNLDQKHNVFFSRWRLPHEANRLNTIRLDVMDLTERVDNAIK